VHSVTAAVPVADLIRFGSLSGDVDQNLTLIHGTEVNVNGAQEVSE
jgi:hypothetical protein